MINIQIYNNILQVEKTVKYTNIIWKQNNELDIEKQIEVEHQLQFGATCQISFPI